MRVIATNALLHAIANRMNPAESVVAVAMSAHATIADADQVAVARTLPSKGGLVSGISGVCKAACWRRSGIAVAAALARTDTFP